ncbi:MAG: radical SAM protein [Negativicutes bacterium]|nr:radical SAM protein [Negativicutes bacterium]
MNILLINVSLRPNSAVTLFPIGLGYVATAMKRAGFEFDLLDIDAYRYSDEEIENIISRKSYDVVCMGCIVTGYKKVKFLANITKKYHPHASVVVGNSVATSIVQTLLTKTEADIAVIGEGDVTVPELLSAIEKKIPLDTVLGIAFKKDGEIFYTPPRPVIQNISELPNIDFDIFDVEKYIQGTKNYVNEPLPVPREEIRSLPLNTARGCVANCGFCYHVFKGVAYRWRSPVSLVAEIESLIKKYSLNYISFWDELTFFSKKQTLEFVECIIESDLRFSWVACCRADLFNQEEDIEIIEKMKAAGCLGVGFSLESSDERILRSMNKHITVDQFSTQTKLFHKAGLAVFTSLVLGYPEETPETIRKTFDCCIENKIYPSAGFLLPQPGSSMYDYAIQNGYIVDEEDYLLKMGDRQDLRINMTSMTDEEFENHVRDGLRKCNEAFGLGLKEENLIKTQRYRPVNWQESTPK